MQPRRDPPRDGTRWEIEGIPSEVIAAATVAARREGMSVADWLSQVIVDAVFEPRARSAPAPEPQPIAASDELLAALKELGERIESSERKASEVLDPLRRQLTALADRVEEIEASRTATAPVERAVARLVERMEALEDSKQRPQRRRGLLSRLF